MADLFQTEQRNVIPMQPNNSSQVALSVSNNYREMLKSAFKLALIALMALSFMSAFGQANVQASLCEQGVIQLPEDQPLQASYFIDVAHMEFESPQAMVSFFTDFVCGMFLVRANPDTEQAMIYLITKDRESWGVAEWNEALQGKCTEKPFLQ